MRKSTITCIAGAMGRHGETVADVGGVRVHVAHALPGEQVRAEVDGTHGRAVDILTSSPERVTPFCRHFGRCGGCAVQHWREEAYRVWKRGLVTTALKHRGIEAEVVALVDAHGAGRRRIRLTVTRHGTGFMAARSHDIVTIDRCPAAVPGLADAAIIASDLGRIAGVPKRGLGVMLTATATGLDVAAGEASRPIEGLERRLADLAAHHDLARLTLGGETVVTRRPPLVRFGEVAVELPPGGFLQATAEGEEVLARLVVAAAAGARRVADLFCGAGPFSLRLAPRAAIAAFDLDRPAVASLDAARRRASGLKPINATLRDLFRNPLRADEMRGMDAVVFDPPRQGAEAQARQIAGSKVPVAIAVSCDPASLARDLAILISGGYRLVEVTPVDQFKWTAHVETVAVLRR